MAFRDPFTKLPNRRLLLETMSRAAARSRRLKSHGSGLLLDRDNFKQLNDSQEDQAGDRPLNHVIRGQTQNNGGHKWQ
jgi:diguanylate cyclase (GGDEF)-like protein